MPKRREIAEFCRFVESDPIEKNYNEDTGEDDIKNLRKGEALLTKDEGSGGIYPRLRQRKLAKFCLTTLI